MTDAAKLCGADEAVAAIAPGNTVMVGGFGLVGAPLTLIMALLRAPGARELTVVSNNLGEPGRGLGCLLDAGRVARAVGSYFTSNPDVLRWHAEGKLDVELLPQGTLAEGIRAGGAGIGGFYTRTAAGTLLAEDKEQRVIDGQTYVLERPLRGDFALVKAARADALGNLAYVRTARNFNPDMATAGDVVIAEVDELVPVGALAPDEIVTPHVHVDRIVLRAAGKGL